MVEKKNLTEISFKELMQDLFETITDFEKKWFRTFWDLTVRPDVVVETYLREGKKTYFSVFRYLLLSIFVGYLSYTFFFKPEAIGGPMYQNLRNGMEIGAGNNTSFGESIFIDDALFDQYYLEAQSLYLNFVKLLNFLMIPAILFSMWIFLRKLRFNFISKLITSVFFGAHAGLLGSLSTATIWLFYREGLGSSVVINLCSLGVCALYLTFALHSIAKNKVKLPIIKCLLTTTLTIVLFLSANLVVGGGSFFYAQTYMPNFVFKKYADPSSPTYPN